MKILSGVYRGRNLTYSPKFSLRPSLSRIRKMVFDTLMPLIFNKNWNDVKILDCFAGTGSYGFEALSNVGGHCTFLEMEREMIKSIKTTATNININDKTNIIWGNSITSIKKLNDKFHLIFLDPPYEKTFLITKLLKKLLAQGNIDENSLIIVENSIHNKWNFIPDDFFIIKDKIASSTRFMILKLKVNKI
jgi:16S rRNA (guanine966-N2)-methyltransferase